VQDFKDIKKLQGTIIGKQQQIQRAHMVNIYSSRNSSNSLAVKMIRPEELNMEQRKIKNMK
jgi:23S rRNA maturation-related 3'-5' exoribonuclease YhaM